MKATEYFNYAVSYLQGGPDEVKTDTKPVRTFINTYCNYEESVLVFRYSAEELVYLTFVQKLQTADKQFTGMQKIEVDENMPNSQIVDITSQENADEDQANVQEANRLIAARNPRVQGREISEVNVRRFPNQERVAIVFKSENR